MLELHKTLILKIPFFAQCEDVFIDALANTLWLEVCLSGADIMKAGDLNEGLYFINHGEVEVVGVAIRRDDEHSRKWEGYALDKVSRSISQRSPIPARIRPHFSCAV